MIYQADRIGDCDSDASDNAERSTYLLRKRKFAHSHLLLNVAVILLVMTLHHRYAAVAYWSGLMLFGLSYGKVFKGLSRRIPGFKDIFVSVMWALLIPFGVLYAGYSWSTSLSFAMTFIFLKMLISVSAFDVKDIKSDRNRGINTFATLWSVARLTQVLQAVNLATGILILFGLITSIMPVYTAFLLLFLPYTWYYLHVLRRRKAPDWLYHVYIDAEMVLWSVLVLCVRLILGA